MLASIIVIYNYTVLLICCEIMKIPSKEEIIGGSEVVLLKVQHSFLFRTAISCIHKNEN